MIDERLPKRLRPAWRIVRRTVQSQVVLALFIGSGLFLLFYLIPRNAATWRTALAGAIFGAVALRLAQALFTGYLRDFGGFDSAYGPIAGLAPCSPGRPRRRPASSCSPRSLSLCSTRPIAIPVATAISCRSRPRHDHGRSPSAATTDRRVFVGDRRARLQSAPHR